MGIDVAYLALCGPDPECIAPSCSAGAAGLPLPHTAAPEVRATPLAPFTPVQHPPKSLRQCMLQCIQPTAIVTWRPIWDPPDVETAGPSLPRSDERKAAATSGEGGGEDPSNTLMEMGKLNTARIKKVRQPCVASPFALARGRRLPWSNSNAVSTRIYQHDR